MTDEQIINLFWERKEEAIVQAKKSYQKLGMHVAKNMIPDLRDQEEVVEDAWLTLWQTIPPERPKYLKAYICRVVKNLSLKRREYLMAQKRSFNVEGSSSYEVALEELEECVKAPETVENVVEGTELKAVLEHFLEGLPRDKRVMFLRRYWFADSVKEISRDFRISEKAASMRLSRIREELRRYLRKEGYEV